MRLGCCYGHEGAFGITATSRAFLWGGMGGCTFSWDGANGPDSVHLCSGSVLFLISKTEEASVRWLGNLLVHIAKEIVQ